MQKEKFLEKSRALHGYKYNYPDLQQIVKYKDKIRIEYNDIIYEQTAGKHLLGKCPEKNTPSKTTEDFIRESKAIWLDRFDYSFVEYNGANKKVKLYDKHNGVFVDQKPTLHLNGFEPKCLDNDNFIQSSKIVSDFIYSYEKCEYRNKSTNVIITCPLHGDFVVKPFNHLNYGYACNKCDFSQMNSSIKSFLVEKKISFNQQHRFDGFFLPFDFYIPSARSVIEIMSQHHLSPVEDFGGVEIHNILKQYDKLKEDYCEEHFINLIKLRWNQTDYIDDILWENLRTFSK